ncbi:MAG: hypothetical protein QOI08_230 [Actinomycetota bacterium]|jgi:hypothetical protein|nr:hypothetical protein [Actinomycetota bacterium]
MNTQLPVVLATESDHCLATAFVATQAAEPLSGQRADRSATHSESISL